jgi:phospholipid/cholesterol/gamma-HCH transport system ATP-binding protein
VVSVGETGETIIKVRDLAVGFGERLVIDGLDLDLYRGEILGVVGGSGSGKSVSLRAIVGLLQKQRGTIEIFGTDVDEAGTEERRALERRWGILFQQGALFSSMTVQQNVEMPLREHTDLSASLREEIARYKIALVGLKPEAAHRFPSELSGGMIKRAALARALALDPEIVFLDEPTSGLDPISAGDFDELLLTLREALGLTVYMVTHDIDSLVRITDRIAALGEGKMLATGPIADMRKSEQPWIKTYFQGPRARAAGV